MPASAVRACFTIWFSDAPRRVRAAPPSELLQSALQQAAEGGGRLSAATAAQLLQQPDVQGLAAKLHYADQWAASIEVRHVVQRISQPALAPAAMTLQGMGTASTLPLRVHARRDGPGLT
jgi:hypothetical protein